MRSKKYWLWWLYLYVLCGVLGFIPEPTGLVKGLLMVLAVVFFVPGFVLIYRADVRDDLETVRQVRLVAIIALCVSVFLICLNMASALLTKAWGDVLYVLLVMLASPLICGQAWVLTLFGWACLLFYSIFVLKKER